MPAVWEEKLEAIDTAEVHWSTGTILAIFFAASLVSAVFFGLGYSFGRGGTAKPAFGMAASGTGNAAESSGHSTLVSTAIAQVPSGVTNRQHDSVAAAANTKQTAVQARASGNALPAHGQAPLTKAAHAALISPKAGKESAAAAQSKIATGATHYMVQVGAIGDQKDAHRLVSQLRQHGFRAGIYPAKHDKFLHVQIGPYTTMEQAQNMRHHVMASGFHAILKRAS